MIWGGDWDDLLARDTTGLLIKRMGECVDGEYQNFKAKGGAYVRKEFFGKYPELLKLVAHMRDEQIGACSRGGHDPQKVYNAYKRAVEHTGSPTVILAKTIKGYGLGEAGEGRNVTHQQKKLNEDEMLYFRRASRFRFPRRPSTTRRSTGRPKTARKCATCTSGAKLLGGSLPARIGSEDRRLKRRRWICSPNRWLVRRAAKSPPPWPSSACSRCCSRTSTLGKYIVPIIPDEARTFGMESLFRQFGIYASQGQLYKPHDSEKFLYYKEAKDGQILEEGITEAGSMASFTAAGTAYANYGVAMIPFFIYYSMFGFQRVGDLIWAFADSRGKGFLMGGTAGRTTLSGEGLQHQDGHSLVLASTVPTCHSYDPAYAYEIAVIVQDGIRRMYQEQEDRFYYLTLYNENYAQPPMPEGVDEGILSGIYRFNAAGERKGAGAALRQRPDPERGLARAENPGREVRRAGRRVERHQLQRTAPRRAGSGALEPPASGRAGAQAVHAAGARRAQRPDRRRHRLHEGGGRPDRAVAARPHGNAGHRRLRPQREPRTSAAAFRERRGIHRRGGAIAPGARRQVRQSSGRRPPSQSWD